MDTITLPGIYVVGALVASKPERNGYRDVYVSTDPAYAPQRFSVRVGSDIDQRLSSVKIGEDVLLSVAAPRIGRTKSGNPYLAGFWILDVVGSE